MELTYKYILQNVTTKLWNFCFQTDHYSNVDIRIIRNPVMWLQWNYIAHTIRNVMNKTFQFLGLHWKHQAVNSYQYLFSRHLVSYFTGIRHQLGRSADQQIGRSLTLLQLNQMKTVKSHLFYELKFWIYLFIYLFNI